MQTESEFHIQVDAVLAAIESAIDAADSEMDTELVGGILTITCDTASGSSKIIINRQTPMREIWVAAKSGGFHFRFDGTTWRDTRNSVTLDALLADVVAQQCGETIAFKFG
jgi:CyaY protein